MSLTEDERKILEAEPSKEPDLGQVKWRNVKKWRRLRGKRLYAPKPRYHPGTKEARKILEQAGRNLKICNSCGSTYRVSVHHKDGNPFNNKLENLMILCADCHAKEHGR